MNIRNLFAAAALCLGLAACATEQPATTTQTAPEHHATPAATTRTEGEDHSALGQHDMPYDAEFLDMMVHHHEMGVQMAEDALKNAQSGEVRSMAERIIADQQAEIEKMRAWRKSWYPNVAAMSVDEMMHHMTPHDMSGSESYDQRFLREMIKHHEQALEMSREAQQKAEHPEVKELAAEIVAKQQKEIQEMEEMRRTASL